METFSCNPPINLAEDEKWLLAVTSFETINSVFISTKENQIFFKIVPGFRNSRGGSETINDLQDISRLRTQNDIELHMEDAKKESRKRIKDKVYKLSDLDTRKWERIKDFKNAEFHDLEDTFFKI